MKIQKPIKYKIDRFHFKHILYKKNIQQKELAERIGITNDTLYKGITGTSRLSFDQIVDIMKILNCKFEEIFIIEEIEKKI